MKIFNLKNNCPQSTTDKTHGQTKPKNNQQLSFQKLNKTLKVFLGSTILAASTLMFVDVSPNLAQSCRALEVVGGQGTKVDKKVTPPSAPPFFRNNWNTDFLVSRDRNYYKYVSTLMPKDSGEYKIMMFLKYSDDTADQVYDQKITLTEGKPFYITGSPRRNDQPYQVNVFVGGLTSVGKSYTLYVNGCR